MKTLTLLDQYLRRVNPYCKIYKSLKDFEEQTKQNNSQAIIPQASLCFMRNKCDDMRRYNKPAQGEIAAVFTGENGVPVDDRDFVVFPHLDTQKLIKLNDMSQHIDPMSYPLLFFFGEPGWTTYLDHSTINR